MKNNCSQCIIGIVANGNNGKTKKIEDALKQKLKAQNIATKIFHGDITNAEALKDFSAAVDIIFAIGGDGTLLSVLRSCGGNDVPVIGINAGRKGFLAEISADDLDFAIGKILSNEFFIDARLMLEAEIYDNQDNMVEKGIVAVNDFSIARHGYARMIRLDVYINDQLAESFDADGVLLSSPTGSTAYSMSAGGPIILPGIDCILITPVCAHSLHTRPMVAPADVKIKIVAKDQLQDVITTVDGQSLVSVPIDGYIVIKKSDARARFVRFRREDYYTKFWKKIISWSIN